MVFLSPFPIYHIYMVFENTIFILLIYTVYRSYDAQKPYNSTLKKKKGGGRLEQILCHWVPPILTKAGPALSGGSVSLFLRSSQESLWPLCFWSTLPAPLPINIHLTIGGWDLGLWYNLICILKDGIVPLFCEFHMCIFINLSLHTAGIWLPLHSFAKHVICACPMF